jgi:hypothetical protein
VCSSDLAYKYNGIAPHSTPAIVADRALREAIGPSAYAAYRAGQADYYRDLIRKAREARV